MNLREYYSRAQSYKEYVAGLGDYLSLHSLHYKKFFVGEQFLAQIKDLRPVKILVITESWCSDSLALLPVFRKIAEINGRWEIRVLRRDENLELTDQFLSDGVRAIPIFIFLDENDNVILRWGPRPREAAEIFNKYRPMIKAGEMEKQDVIKKIRAFYAKDRGQKTMAELMKLFSQYLVPQEIENEWE